MEITEAEFDAAEKEVADAIAVEKESLGRHPYAECCPICARNIEEILPVIKKMGEMFDAIESAREANPMVARLFGLGSAQAPKESRKDRKARLAEIQEMGEDDA